MKAQKAYILPAWVAKCVKRVLQMTIRTFVCSAFNDQPHPLGRTTKATTIAQLKIASNMATVFGSESISIDDWQADSIRIGMGMCLRASSGKNIEEV